MINLQASVLAILLGCTACAPTPGCGDDTLCRIKAAGVLRIGAKDDYVPWSYRGPDGQFKGMEVEIGKRIAAALGVRAEFIKVNSANRFEFLSQGQIDLMIASASDTAQRRRVVSFVHPNYYSSGYTAFLPKTVKATQWAQLSGKTLCAVQGGWYNKLAQEKFGVDILAFAGTVETEAAMAQGRCIGLIEDDNLINIRLSDPKWAGHHKPLPVEADTPWAMAVRRTDAESPFQFAVAGVIAEMHRDGTFLKLERNNGIANSSFLIRMHNALKDHID